MTKKNNYDLEERTAKLSESIIMMCKKVPNNTINKPIVSQLVRSATSIGANYCEANGASSKRDFKNKIHLCKKEAMETKYWLRLLAKSQATVGEECERLWGEVQELTLIFSKIIGTINQPAKRK
jgi:four helix bundle protein